MLLTLNAMKIDGWENIERIDAESSFRADCIAGLSAEPKTLPCKWLYDPEGSRLFEAICRVPEYYPSRTEAALLARAAPDIAAGLMPGTALVEYGSGASRKTRLLLDAAPTITTYVPIDICHDELAQSCATVATAYPGLRVMPVLSDFTRPLILDPALDRSPRMGFFPGSTLGNFAPDDAADFLRLARATLGAHARFLLGVDLRKDERTLVAAYDDAGGVTAAFNLNLLTRINRELGCSIDLDAFEHRAVWNEDASRVEMHLASTIDQQITISGRKFSMVAGETIHTENCHKFTLVGLSALAERSGWTVRNVWIEELPAYALLMLDAA